MPRTRSLNLFAPASLPMVQPGDNLCHLISRALRRENQALFDGDILVVAQKIVSKAEGRIVRLADVTPSDRAGELAAQVNKDPRLVQLILDESNEVLRYRRDVLIVEHRLGFVMANAGIDMSNVLQEVNDDTALLLPENPDRSAQLLREELGRAFGAAIGVIINDSHGRAWRNGTVGVAIGVAGISAVNDLRGTCDMHGRTLVSSEVGTADELASAGSALMGQSSEATPVVVIRGVSWKSNEDAAATDLIRPREYDMFR